MGNANIRIEGLEKLTIKLRAMRELKQVRGAIKAAGLYVKGQVAKYPAKKRLTRKSVYGSTFKTLKQRRWFFAALRKGEISVPYRRGSDAHSQTLGRSWTIDTSANAGLTAVVGTNVSYARYQQDRDKQSLYAKTVGWRTVQAVMEDGEVTRTVTEQVMAAVEKAMNEGGS